MKIDSRASSTVRAALIASACRPTPPTTFAPKCAFAAARGISDAAVRTFAESTSSGAGHRKTKPPPRSITTISPCPERSVSWQILRSSPFFAAAVASSSASASTATATYPAASVIPREAASSFASIGSLYARASKRSQNERRRFFPPPISRESSTAIEDAVKRIGPCCSSSSGALPFGKIASHPSGASPERIRAASAREPSGAANATSVSPAGADCRTSRVEAGSARVPEPARAMCRQSASSTRTAAFR